MPVQVLGLQGTPNAGDEILAVENERKAREVALYRQGKFRDVKLAKQASKMQDVFAQMEEQKVGSHRRSCSRPTCRAAPRRCAMR